MSKQVKEWARKARAELLEELGAFCHWPACKERRPRMLTFDHKFGKDYETTGLSTDQRMVLYRKEAKEGLLQVLCRKHNERRGDPDMSRDLVLRQEYEQLLGVNLSGGPF